MTAEERLRQIGEWLKRGCGMVFDGAEKEDVGGVVGGVGEYYLLGAFDAVVPVVRRGERWGEKKGEGTGLVGG